MKFKHNKNLFETSLSGLLHTCLTLFFNARVEPLQHIASY